MFRRELEIRGSYMSSRTAPRALMCLVESGLLKAEQLDVKTFRLTEITQAIEHARKYSALQFSVVAPNS